MRVNLKPCSVNRAWQGRRFKTNDYKDFEKGMLLLIKNTPLMAQKDYGIYLKFHLKNVVASDLSNFIKTTEDIIVKAGIVKDDRYCWRMLVDKFRSESDYLEFDIIELVPEERIDIWKLQKSC